MTTDAPTEQRLQAARTQEERERARRDSRTFSLSLIYTDEEADIVRKALGNSPAQTVLEMCRARLGGQSQP